MISKIGVGEGRGTYSLGPRVIFCRWCSLDTLIFLCALPDIISPKISWSLIRNHISPYPRGLNFPLPEFLTIHSRTWSKESLGQFVFLPRIPKCFRSPKIPLSFSSCTLNSFELLWHFPLILKTPNRASQCVVFHNPHNLPVLHNYDNKTEFWFLQSLMYHCLQIK